MNPLTDQNDVTTALGHLRDSLSEEEQSIVRHAIDERRPGGDAHERWHFPFIHGDAEIATGEGDFENFLLFVE